MFQRIKNLIRLSKLPDEVAPKTLRALIGEPLGDGNAEFLGNDMTEEEYAVWMQDEEHGWKSLKSRLFGSRDKEI